MSTSGLEISSTLTDMHAVFGKEHNFGKHTGMYRHELDRWKKYAQVTVGME